MDLGTAPLFDLTAPVAGEAETTVLETTGPERTVPGAPVTRSEELVAGLRANRAALVECQINEVRQIAEWAAEHTVSDEAAAATITERGLDTGLPVAGPGAPLISDFAVMELAAALGRTLDSGRNYVGQVVELGYRLPKTWARVLAGRVPVWKALRITDATRLLPADAAGYVDRHLAPFAHGCTWAQIDRLVEEALVRYDPQTAQDKRKAAQDARRFDIDLDRAGCQGTAHIAGTLDIADALDLDAALARRAKLLGQLGCQESLDVRRAIAAGELARHDLALDLEVCDPDTGELTHTVPGRTIDLIVHLNAATLAGTGVSNADGAVGRFANTRTPISPEQIRAWINNPGTHLTVRPVLDLNGCQPTDAYEIPDRIRRHVTLRDHHCVYPHCTRPAESCDIDHVIAYADHGPTCPCNTAPLCRGHHRLKTSGRTSYRTLTPGTYLWTGPHEQHWLVDPTGTHDLHPATPQTSVPPDQ